MFQTRASLAEDPPRLGEGGAEEATALFVEADDLEAVERALTGEELVQPRRKTPYESTEIAIREPGGHFVTFARFGAGPDGRAGGATALEASRARPVRTA